MENEEKSETEDELIKTIKDKLNEISNGKLYKISKKENGEFFVEKLDNDKINIKLNGFTVFYDNIALEKIYTNLEFAKSKQKQDNLNLYKNTIKHYKKYLKTIDKLVKEREKEIHEVPKCKEQARSLIKSSRQKIKELKKELKNGKI